MRYKLVIFDMDGTILNTLEDLTDSLNFTLETAGFPTRRIEEVRQFVGNGIQKLVERGVPQGADSDSVKRVYETFKAYYKLHCADKTRPYSGILELLCQLRNAGCKTAVVSNKADFAVQSLCTRYFDGLFDAAVGDRDGIRKKPAPDSVNEVLRQLGVARDDAVYIGDSDVDIETAQNACIDEIAVDWGFRDRTFLQSRGAKHIVSAPKALEALLIGATKSRKSLS